MNIRIVTASAGTGKTTHLCRLLADAVATGTARAEAIVATTFTKQAAAELLNRARSELLRAGQGRAAEALMTARMGTVNSVCGGLVSDFALSLGLSPELRVLDETAAELELVRALAAVVDAATSGELDSFKAKFDQQFDWHYEVKRIIETARANGIAATELETCARRSHETLEACLGPTGPDEAALDGALRSALETAIKAIESNGDTTVGTGKYLTLLKDSHRGLLRERLRWGDWTKLAGAEPTKKSLVHANGVKVAAAAHVGHPRLRAEMHALIDALFRTAAAGMNAYQDHKSELGLLDYVDQEALALQALRTPEIREALVGKFDLVLVDEFQDTSPLQLTIFLELARLAGESVWVGDPKQAIYGFRGTDPALMDRAIESLSNPRDPDLVAAVADRVAGRESERVSTLSTSYRSRPAMVELTNEIFAPAFRSQGMPEKRTRVEPKLQVDPPELGPAFAHWRLEGKNKADRARSLAAGAAALLETRPQVRDRQTGALRAASLADVAILCRTNEQCGAVAEALGEQALPAVVARAGLLDTAEGQVLVAGLRLWIDARDRLAAGVLHRILEHPLKPERFVADVLAEGENTPVLGGATAEAVVTARRTQPDVDVLGAIDAVIAATGLCRLCGEWGDSAQRTANLDAFRAHAGAYCEERLAGRDTPSLVGFLRYLGEMIPGEWDWGASRTDRCALLAGHQAIRVSTWHAAKGLEWPIVVLYGLESLSEPLAYGVHVMSDRHDFDLADPLAGRWIRFWPNPYTTSNQQGVVKSAYERSAAFDDVKGRAAREALRVLYVGWTRARDRLILAAESGCLLDGLLGTLARIDTALISEPSLAGVPASGPQEIEVTWAGRATTVELRGCLGKPPVATEPQPGAIRAGRLAPPPYAPARLIPSAAEARAFTVREVLELGAPIASQGRVDVNILGTAVHAFLAADSSSLGAGPRQQIAARLIEGYGIESAISASALVAMGDRLWAWLAARFPSARIRREWPMAQRLPAGTVMAGTADLIVEATDHLAIIDHKSSATFEGALAQAGDFSAQLASYAQIAVRAGWGGAVSTWIHLPFAGRMVEVTAG
jgi:ATP-dependent exoDNAse (exonuclease V) beta subunit